MCRMAKLENDVVFDQKQCKKAVLSRAQWKHRSAVSVSFAVCCIVFVKQGKMSLTFTFTPFLPSGLLSPPSYPIALQDLLPSYFATSPLEEILCEGD